MKCVSYNIQFGFGDDARFDLGRIVEAVRGADVIALQEVTRNSPMNEGRDLVADIRAMLPDYFAAYGPNLEADVGSHIRDGKAVDVRLQFGNMILSRKPILTSRNLLLPRTRSYDRVNLQRGALAVTGISEMGFPEPPVPEAYILMGDFNMLPGSPEYHAVAGTPDHEFGTPLVARHAVDAGLLADGDETPTCVNLEDPEDASRHKRLDYCFVHPLLASRVKSLRVDTAARGSDHKPVWLELG